MNNGKNDTIKDVFLEPRKRFWLRSRKRPKSDAISISSMDISIESEIRSKKKRRRITEVATSIFSGNTINNKHGNTFHGSCTIPSISTDISFIENETNEETLKKKQINSIERINNYTLRSWVLDVAKTNTKNRQSTSLSRKEVKRQEAIYELYCGENIILSDLCILKDFYYEPLIATDIFTSDEILTLFGSITHLIEIHGGLRDELVCLRDQYGFTETVGPTLLNWIPSLRKPYLERCRTQIWAKHLLDEKRLTNKRFQSFLKKRLESPHSVDLWTCIDVARSRIVKYPLLVKEILRHTSATNTDQTLLRKASDMLSDLLKDINKTMGAAECKLAQSKINIKSDYDLGKCIENATELITEGQLKDARGMKFHCFLFDTCFAITRGPRSQSKKYSLSLPVIPKEQIYLDVEQKSFGNTAFKIANQYFITEDEHGKRHWIDSFNKIQLNKTNQSESVIDINDKENQLNFTPEKINHCTRPCERIKDENELHLSSETGVKEKGNSTTHV